MNASSLSGEWARRKAAGLGVAAGVGMSMTVLPTFGNALDRRTEDTSQLIELSYFFKAAQDRRAHFLREGLSENG